jgi:hypothetical protein
MISKCESPERDVKTVLRVCSVESFAEESYHNISQNSSDYVGMCERE